MTDLTWGESLKNLRVAYRTVAAYQERVLSMAKIAGEAFEPLSFAVWFATEHAMAPQRTTDPRNKWTWDFLPMNSFALCLNSSGKRRWTIREGELVVFLYFCADDGFTSYGHANPAPEGPDPAMLPSASEADSWFEMYAYRWLGSDCEIDCYDDLWATDDLPGSDLCPVTSKNGEFSLSYFGVSISELETQESFSSAVSGFKARLEAEVERA
ncbi:hypothetical protein SAMN06297129_1225 [Pseudooceanicola antarcticus]|uniref:Uncharacterized protein n=1 Tax=Pseudooceanicola antarcticus TaxID=1247613 RepID=A0A285IIA0_9RHOB|nr:hypothetical protein [Pseudooceanicola antarcticus]PJE28918.1 hypothetical protein CVM39_10705 [Pseudooceanicola antarcticus]SNY47699.1 hypothetical protein SAMN06297129_1225 [Pseudooceanicola antarcticus]